MRPQGVKNIRLSKEGVIETTAHLLETSTDFLKRNISTIDVLTKGTEKEKEQYLHLLKIMDDLRNAPSVKKYLEHKE